jgi:hypothetical protein
VIDSKRRVVHGEKEKHRGRCKHHYSKLMAAQCAHIASSRDTGRLARSASRTTIGCKGERTPPWEFRGDDFFAESGRVVSSSQQAKVLREEVARQTLKPRYACARTEAFMRKTMMDRKFFAREIRILRSAQLLKMLIARTGVWAECALR